MTRAWIVVKSDNLIILILCKYISYYIPHCESRKNWGSTITPELQAAFKEVQAIKNKQILFLIGTPVPDPVILSRMNVN